MGTTSDLARFGAAVALPGLPLEVIFRTRLLVLDLVGNIVRARHDAESTQSLLGAARALGLGAGHAAVFGDPSRWTPAGAAFLNGALARSLDFDDTHAATGLHPGAAVIPAALAAGEMTGASGAEVLAGIVAGYEIACRMALALPARSCDAVGLDAPGPGECGFQPAAICGAFGAAAAAGRVLGLDAGGMESALGIALGQSAGSSLFLGNGAWTRRFQIGWAGMAGLAAATLAVEGFRNAGPAFEGLHGFLRAVTPDPTPERAVQGLGTVFELMRTAATPYPTCRSAHAGIDAALALRAAHALRTEAIESVTYGLTQACMSRLSEPVDQTAGPQSVTDGQASVRFAIACALATGAMDWDSYRLLRDPAILALLPKLRCEHDAELEALGPMAGRLTVVTRGRTVSHTVAMPTGEPETFPTAGDVRGKFDALVTPVLGPERAGRLANAVLTLDALSDIARLTRLGSPVLSARLAGE